MKRHGNLWPLITSEDNIRRAYIKAKRHKSKHNGVKKFKENVDENLKLTRDILIYKTFRTGSYYEKIIHEPMKNGVDFLGYRHFDNYKLLRKRTAKRVAKRLASLEARYATGEITAEYCRSALASAKGWITWANTFNFQRKVRLAELMEWVALECKEVRESTVLSST